VNGIRVQRVALCGGDQIGLAMHRFVLEAPGKNPEPESTDSGTTPGDLPETAAGPSGEVWWLIVTAAVLAVAIALVLLIRF
jgi:hypothetical protein